MNIHKNLFAPSVDSLTYALTNTARRLEAHAERLEDKSHQLAARADELLTKADETAVESVRAYGIATRIAGLVA